MVLYRDYLRQDIIDVCLLLNLDQRFLLLVLLPLEFHTPVVVLYILLLQNSNHPFVHALQILVLRINLFYQDLLPLLNQKLISFQRSTVPDGDPDQVHLSLLLLLLLRFL